MKRLGILLAATLCLVPVSWAQAPRERQQNQQQNQQQDQQNPPPTLGGQPGPTNYGPRTSTTNDPRRLVRIRSIFVDRMDNHLGEKLFDGISKQGRFKLVEKQGDADAVLRGTCDDLRRLKVLHSEVFITDRRSGASIWQDNIRRSFNPPPLDKAVNETALAILQHLADSIEEAERK